MCLGAKEFGIRIENGELDFKRESQSGHSIADCATYLKDNGRHNSR